MWKFIKTSDQYKYVSLQMESDKLVWIASPLKKSKTFDNERDAALYVDKVLIQNGKKPVNILKPYTKI